MAIAVAIPLNSHTYRHTLRLCRHFDLFRDRMPGTRWPFGEAFVKYLCSLDNWLACGILCLLGGKMIWESFHEEETRDARMATQDEP